MTTAVAQSADLKVDVVACLDEHASWSAPEVATAAQVVLVRKGRFRLQAQGRPMTIDPTTGYLQVSGDEASFSHPAGGDVCTAITLFGEALTESIGTVRVPDVRVDARLELAHRMLVRDPDDVEFATVDSVVNLLQLAVRRAPDDLPAPGRRSLADRAREAILADDPASAGLVTLARQLETSASHLSRTFRHHAGMSISRYRNRVRVSRALSRFDDGDVDLADVATALGFSDQAHLTRVMKRELGRTPRNAAALLQRTTRARCSEQ